MDEGEAEIRLVLQHLLDHKIISEKEFMGMCSAIKDDGTLTALAGISAAVQDDPNAIPSELLDEILALEPVFDEEYYQDMLDALAARPTRP